MYTNMRSPHEPAPTAEWTAYDYLRHEILSGRLPGGTPLRQEAIAAKLRISRIPVRDAMRHLIAAGLVTIESNRRAIVTLLRESDLSELFQMRAVLEGLAARHAVAHLTDEDIDRLTWLAARMDRIESIAEEWMPVHDEFHEILCNRSGMPRLAAEINRLRHRVEPYVRVLITLHGAAELRMSRHKNLIAGIRDRDPDRAEQAVREHVTQASREILTSIKTSPLGGRHGQMSGRNGFEKKIAMSKKFKPGVPFVESP